MLQFYKKEWGKIKLKEYKIDNHVSSFLPEEINWKLVWNDEFDGTELDRTKWDYRLSIWGNRHVTFDDEGVRLDGNSNAVFSIYEKNGEICSSHLQTGYNYMDAIRGNEDCWGGGLIWPIGDFKKHKFTHKYGYYECRCKLQKKPGWWSAFWLQSPTIGTSPVPENAGVENDIMESFKPGIISQHCNHYNGYGGDHKFIKTGKRRNIALDEYHTFGMHWSKNGYIFYVDGKKDGRIEGPVSHTEQFILLSTEVDGYRQKRLTATDEARAAVGDEFIVDYVRVFDEVSEI